MMVTFTFCKAHGLLGENCQWCKKHQYAEITAKELDITSETLATYEPTRFPELKFYDYTYMRPVAKLRVGFIYTLKQRFGKTDITQTLYHRDLYNTYPLTYLKNVYVCTLSKHLEKLGFIYL
jgi:hypothetical protein